MATKKYEVLLDFIPDQGKEMIRGGEGNVLRMDEDEARVYVEAGTFAPYVEREVHDAGDQSGHDSDAHVSGSSAKETDADGDAHSSGPPNDAMQPATGDTADSSADAGQESDDSRKNAQSQPNPPVQDPGATTANEPKASMAARKRAGELRVDLRSVPATGLGGSVTVADVNRFAGVEE